MLARLLTLGVRYTLRPENAAQRLKAAPSRICYVLERESAVDLAVLQRACERYRLPRPGRRLRVVPAGTARRVDATDEHRSWLPLERTVGLWRQRQDRRPPPLLTELVRRAQEDAAFEVSLVPAAVYWGRAPQKERSWLRLFLAEDWALASRLRGFFTVLFNGRNTMVVVGEPLSLRALVGAPGVDGPSGDTGPAARRVARALRAEFAQHRAAHIGPDLSHRRTIVTSVLGATVVRAAVVQEMREKRVTRRAALEQARGYLDEIAANYSAVFVTFMERALTRLWNRLYDGVEIGHASTLQEAAGGNEVIYVPCHRSHMDYILLSYAIYRQGYAIPHIAAGINLDIAVIGRFLRKGGAFFIRRSFRGNALYTVVFVSYLAEMIARGHPIEYFIEGGRSRTGRLLRPKTGMLAMTVRSFLREPKRPVVFVPVYFGYERVMEVKSYLGELSGKPKEKESALMFLRTLRRLRERFGRVHVNLGEPIHLDALLARSEPRWRELADQGEARAAWTNAAVDELAFSIMRNINSAAAVTPVSLLAIVLLATPQQVLLRRDLESQLALAARLLREFPYHERVTVTPLSATEIVDYGVSMEILVVDAPAKDAPDAAADQGRRFVRFAAEHGPHMPYYRNNVLHLFAIPSLLACCFISNAELRSGDIQRLAARIYPYIADELFLRWREAEVAAVIERALQALASVGLLGRSPDGSVWSRPPASSPEAVRLSLLARPMLQTIERYYLAIALLLQAGSGALTQGALEQRCQQKARQMVALHGLASPEFFDKGLFSGFVDLLRERGVLKLDAGGKLTFDELLPQIVADAELVLSEPLRHSVLQVIHA